VIKAKIADASFSSILKKFFFFINGKTRKECSA